MKDILGVERNFAALSTKDLLDARDQYHWHLIHKRNVVGTAIGLYYIRKSDPWPSETHTDSSYERKTRRMPKGPRTFENSEVREYSWPCVIVLVKEWLEPTEFGVQSGQLDPEEMLPKTLYMPDGRTVPVCVVRVDQTVPDQTILPAWHWPEHLIGGGFPIISSAQGVERVASVGCLVTDGHQVYALTSRHVAGPEGHPVETVMRGRTTEIGKSSARQLTRLPFTQVYTEFTARRTFLTLDAGLIDVSAADDWTSQVYGLPEVGDLADLSERNIGTRLINAEVVAYGAASGLLRGRIAALFFRHHSVGGYDEVTDFLIAPLPGEPNSQPGDSGTVWHLQSVDPNEPLRPIALQWGGQGILSTDPGKTFNFALAAGLSNVLRLLEVELVGRHNTGAQPFWGKTGHYSIGTFACEHVTSANLKTLIMANQDRISFAAADLKPKEIDKKTKDAKKQGTFVPLADVPDVIWKNVPWKVTGGRDTGINSGPEHPTHYADIDEPHPTTAKTLRQISIADHDKVSVGTWRNFYQDLGHTASDEQGLLPFRVWQFFDAMVAALNANDLTAFVCAAGTMAHYVGDACQPLHGSFLADGFKDGRGKGVHSAYETTMIDHHAQALLAKLHTELAQVHQPAVIHSGHGAAVAIVKLMDRTAQRIDPATLIDAYIATGGGKSKAVTTALFTAFGDATAQVMADGTLTLAMLWESAWRKAGAEQKFAAQQLTAIDPGTLQVVYEQPTFVPSLDLATIGPVLQ